MTYHSWTTDMLYIAGVGLLAVIIFFGVLALWSYAEYRFQTKDMRRDD